jgi:hypothetical protein
MRGELWSKCPIKQDYDQRLRRVRRGYLCIPKAKWRCLTPAELDSVLAQLAFSELRSRRLSTQGRLRRRRLEAIALFRQLHGPLSEVFEWVRKNLRTPKHLADSVKFRSKPMWHIKRLDGYALHRTPLFLWIRGPRLRQPADVNG